MHLVPPYFACSGTSFAAPHVSGVAAQIISTFPANESLTADAVKQRLLDMATEGIVKGLPNPGDQLGRSVARFASLLSTQFVFRTKVVEIGTQSSSPEI